MAALNLTFNQSLMDLTANLRQAFSGIVAGNIKPQAQDAIAQAGKFKLHGDPILLAKMDAVLTDFIAQHRMKLPTGKAYEPCYEIITGQA